MNESGPKMRIRANPGVYIDEHSLNELQPIIPVCNSRFYVERLL